MKLTLGNNIASLRAVRQLEKSSSSLGQIFERLASGQRINRASDDAAGLAIADSLRADARLTSQAIRNINDGISVINLMDSTLTSQTGILFRLSELAEQSANGVYSEQQRAALQIEYETLVDEFGRIADTVSFNGQELLSGASDEIMLQAGIDGELSSILELMTADTGTNSGVINILGDFVAPIGDIDVDDFLYHGNQVSISRTVDELAATFGNALLRTTLADGDGNERNILVSISEAVATSGEGPLTIGIYVENETTGEYDYVTNDSSSTQDDLAASLYEITLSSDGFTGQQLSLDLTGLDVNSSFYNGDRAASAINFTGIETATQARHALEVVQNRIAEISSTQGQLGAVQSRLEAAGRVLSSSNENLIAAESRIRDTDTAAEVANLVRNQILQQTSAAILAQANQQPALALRVLSNI